ncbi:MAG: cysteine desulfurase [Firmicutes bacterium]|nr:cysteine desulfurase [Bacillota bacterium]
MAEVYLDNAATTPVLREVADEMTRFLCYAYGNPSSSHRKGLEAERAVREARERVARLIGARADDIVFTSGGTEANALAIIGAARARTRRRHIITGSTEHSSVLNACQLLEAEGFSVTRLPVDRTGRIEPEQVKAALRDDTALVSLMWVNNELGTLHPVADIARAVKALDPDILVHVDAVQAVGKVPVAVDNQPFDLLSASAHKIHGPKGVGLLWVRAGVRLVPLFGTGSQERGLRPGTENVAGIVGFGQAAARAAETLPEAGPRMARLRDRLWSSVKEAVPWAVLNGPPDPAERAPHILNVSFPGLKGEVLVHALADEGVYVSTGSACSSRRPGHSHVLTALGLSDDVAGGALRLSLSPLTTEAEIDRAAERIARVVEQLRQLVGA